ncbi:MAG: hypothetical protein NC299_01725 [Lachnospiraceae bacterium]|nr:hypothetical protein [Ruminococcus sp.]MCM1274067.1 hypothetical protein [Lachnospiraceae bacterium]
MSSALEKLMQFSLKGYTDSVDEAEAIFDRVMEYTMSDIFTSWRGEPGEDESLLYIITKIYEDETYYGVGRDKTLAHMKELGIVLEESVKRLPWMRLLSSVTLVSLFGAYSRKTKHGYRFVDMFLDLKGKVSNYLGLRTDGSVPATVGEVLSKALRELKRPWNPSDSLDDYADKIRGCGGIIGAIFYEPLIDIYGVKGQCSKAHARSLAEADCPSDRAEAG